MQQRRTRRSLRFVYRDRIDRRRRSEPMRLPRSAPPRYRARFPPRPCSSWTALDAQSAPGATVIAPAPAQSVRPTRKPILLFRLSVVFLLRFAERRFWGLLFQDPPRKTRRQGAVQASRVVAGSNRPPPKINWRRRDLSLNQSISAFLAQPRVGSTSRHLCPHFSLAALMP